MVARPHHLYLANCWIAGDICRFSCSTVYLFLVLSMNKLHLVVKLVNQGVVKLLLTIIYLLVFVPYRLFISKPKAGWHNQRLAKYDNLEWMW